MLETGEIKREDSTLQSGQNAVSGAETSTEVVQIEHLVTAANAESAAKRAAELVQVKNSSSEQVEQDTVNQQNSTQDVVSDAEQISRQINDMEYTLAELEPQARAGDKKAINELVLLSIEQDKLREQLENAQRQRTDQGQYFLLSVVLQRLIAAPIERLFQSFNAVPNKPLEALRSTALQAYEESLKTSGKSNFFGIRSTLWAMKGMRKSPQQLADQIASLRRKKEDYAKAA